MKCRCDGKEYAPSKTCFTCNFKENFDSKIHGKNTMKYKTTTPTNIRKDSEAIFDYICTHKPVVIESAVRSDIVMLLHTDYENMRLELKSAKAINEEALCDTESLLERGLLSHHPVVEIYAFIDSVRSKLNKDSK